MLAKSPKVKKSIFTIAGFSSILLEKTATHCFLDASSHLYKRVCPSVGPSVRYPFSTIHQSSIQSLPHHYQSFLDASSHLNKRVCPSVGPSVRYPVSYTHLRAHETPEHLVCRLLLEKKNVVNAGLLNCL